MIVRSALRQVLSEIPGCEIVGEAEDGVQAAALCKREAPTLLTLDSAMPVASGMEILGEVRRSSPGTKVCLVTGIRARGHLAEWVAAGVDGIVFKSCPTDEIRACFASLLDGEPSMSPAVTAMLDDLDPVKKLTSRERQVLHSLARGHSNIEIATRLSISPKTVDNHRTRLMAKLGVHSLAQLLAYALREGLMDHDSQF